MKQYSIYILFIFCLIFTSCSNNGCEIEYPNNALILTLNCRAHTTRTTIEGIDGYNENKINNLDIFFYPTGSDFTYPAVYRTSISRLALDQSGEIEITIPKENLSLIFGEYNSTNQTYKNQTALIYVIANLPSNIILKDNASINQLKATTISTDFQNGKIQNNFIMDSKGYETQNEGLIAITTTNEKNIISGNINLYRAAAKITLTITEIKDTIIIGNTTYTSDPTNMKVYIHRGVNKSNIDNSISKYDIQPNDYFDIETSNAISYKSITTNVNGTETNIYEQTVPFYSYPTEWNIYDPNDVTNTGNDTNEAYLTLVIPWHDGSKYSNCYYQIPINSQNKNLERNNYYKINLKVNRLGSFNEAEETIIVPSYVILDWNTNSISASLENFRYLMVKNTFITLHNIDELYIPFITSHNTRIKEGSIFFSKRDISGITERWINDDYDALEIRDEQIYFKNNIKNDYTSDEFDFTPHLLTFTIEHIDNEDYYEVISILQYPAIYGDFRTNSAFSNDNNSNNDNINHYTIVNGYYSDSEGNNHTNLNKQDFFNSVPGLVVSGASPNIYIFTITSVKGTNYIIGDPRTIEIDNNLVGATCIYRSYSNQTAWVQAPDLNGSIRGLRYYYPTDASNYTKNIIAPKFRIASAYAVLHPGSGASTSLDGMRKRCASYQEDGYPAGRWRLPTEAEFKFIISQVDKGTLPELYIKNETYWCAHGLGRPQGNGTIEMTYTTTSSGHSTRCVYDDWYWGSEPAIKNHSIFTWGDEPR